MRKIIPPVLVFIVHERNTEKLSQFIFLSSHMSWVTFTLSKSTWNRVFLFNSVSVRLVYFHRQKIYTHHTVKSTQNLIWMFCSRTSFHIQFISLLYIDSMAVSYLTIHKALMGKVLAVDIARNIFNLMMAMNVCNVNAIRRRWICRHIEWRIFILWL